jgi:hypothetical protein
MLDRGFIPDVFRVVQRAGGGLPGDLAEAQAAVEPGCGGAAAVIRAAAAEVVRELQARAANVHALVRDPRAAAEKLGDVDLTVGDFGDRESLRRALTGVE